ncbi:MAG: hypothetical protein R6W78_03685 [Bacteroidales bacterium]
MTANSNLITRAIVIVSVCISLNSYSQDLENLKNTKPVDIKGNIGASAIFYDVEGKKASREPFAVVLRGEFDISLYGVAIPISFLLSDQQREFMQPLNRFGLSPQYKWAKAHLGHRSLNYSKYTLAGHNINGAGIELTPKNFRFAIIHGTLLKAIEEQRERETQKWQNPAFKRTGTIVKAGYGTSDNFVDIVFLKASDKLNSLDSIPVMYNIQPAENMLLGMVTKQKIAGNLFFDLEYAQSYYTRDIRSPETDTVKGFLLAPLKGFYDHRSTTLYGSALEANLSYQVAKYGMKLRFERVDPGYRSMGAYYFLSDLQNITLEPRINLFENKLIINLRAGFQRDNLSNIKESTTKRTISSFNITSQPLKNYSINAFYSNFGIGQKSGISTVDTLLELSQATLNTGLMQSYLLQGDKVVNTFFFNVNYQKLNDANTNTSSFTEFNTMSITGGYSAFVIRFKLNAGINLIHTSFENNTTKNAYTGPSIILSKSFAKNKASVSLNQTIMGAKINDEKISTISTFALRTSYKITKSQRVSARFQLHSQKAQVQHITPFTETKGEINYVYQF